ncbi:MAG: GGDEF domain-containing protein [Candidatus Brocadiia bacterium]
MEPTFENVEDVATGGLQIAGAGIYLVDSRGKITDWNRYAEKLTGWSRKDVIGKHCSNILNAQDADGRSTCLNGCPMKTAFQEQRVVERDLPLVFLQRKAGDDIAARMTVSPVTDERDNVIGGICLFVDMTEHEKGRRQLEKQATTDKLTGLSNRSAFNKQIRAFVSWAERYKRKLSLLFIDVDDFKDYNDRYGHEEGDIVLGRLGQMLRNETRATDMAFRWGGEEFVLVLPESEFLGARRLAERLRKKFARLEFHPAGAQKPVSKTVSIGVAQHETAITPDELLKRADRAMYCAKNRGKNAVAAWSEEKNSNSPDQPGC